MTWLQPPGHVHAMIAETAQPNGARVRVQAEREAAEMLVGAAHASGNAEGRPRGRHAELSRGGGGSLLSASAQMSDDKDTVVVRLVSPLSTPIGPNGTTALRLQVVLGELANCTSCALTRLAAADTSMANPSWNPGLVAPAQLPCAVDSGGHSATLPLAPFSYNVVSFKGCH